MTDAGELRRSPNGRWEYGARELTCGDVVEVDIGAWVRGRIEHDGRDYILLGPDGRTAIRLRAGLPARTPGGGN